MIREVENYETMKITVVLKDGTAFENCDIPPTTVSESERLLSFWYNDCLLFYPMEQVDHFIYTFKNESDLPTKS